jgi:hypothetical protein
MRARYDTAEETANRRRAGDAGGSDGPDHPVQRLQQSRGNQAVQALAERGVQPKLTVDAPDTPAEREADRVADEVMRTAAPERERMGEETADADRPSIRRSTPARDSSMELSGEAESRIKRLKGGGRPLREETRSYFEPRFGADFGDVNVHTGPEAERAADSVNAKAFAHGNDVVFGRGASPGINRTTAHELTHVVQPSRQQRINRVDLAEELQNRGVSAQTAQDIVANNLNLEDVLRFTNRTPAPSSQQLSVSNYLDSTGTPIPSYNRQHFYDVHTSEHFDFQQRAPTNATGTPPANLPQNLWPPGTDVDARLQETLDQIEYMETNRLQNLSDTEINNQIQSMASNAAHIDETAGTGYTTDGILNEVLTNLFHNYPADFRRTTLDSTHLKQVTNNIIKNTNPAFSNVSKKHLNKLKKKVNERIQGAWREQLDQHSHRVTPRKQSRTVPLPDGTIIRIGLQRGGGNSVPTLRQFYPHQGGVTQVYTPEQMRAIRRALYEMGELSQAEQQLLNPDGSYQ